MFTDGNYNLLIIDDLQICTLNNPFIADIFSRESHHTNLSVFFNFHQAKCSRDISLNAHYLILFKNPRDNNQTKISENNSNGEVDKLNSNESQDSDLKSLIMLPVQSSLKSDIKDPVKSSKTFQTKKRSIEKNHPHRRKLNENQIRKGMKKA